MKNVVTYLMEHADEMSRFGKRLSEAVACCGGHLAAPQPGINAGRAVHPLGWEDAVKAHACIWFNGRFTDEDVATVRDGCLALALRVEKFLSDGYWPQELMEAKIQAVARLREEVAGMLTAFNQERPDR